MNPSPSDDRDALLLRIGRLIVGDPALRDASWDAYALIVRYGDGAIDRRIGGFRYRDAGGYEAATPRAPALGEALDALREATRVDGEAPWSACVLRLRRDSGRLHADFEYDDPARWDISPDNLHDIAVRAGRVSTD